MSDFSRRYVLGGAAGGMLASLAAAEAVGQAQPPSGPAPKVLTGNELPSFRYPLGAATGQDLDGGWAKEATVAEFPVSEKLAGVLMQLEPGGLRELHWHANAAEWAYVHRRAAAASPPSIRRAAPRSSTSAPGDVWYFPRGHGHSIQGIGREDCQFVLVFDNGYFSEFGTFSISDWIGHTPPEVLAKNFGVPAQTFADFPKKEVYIAQGPGAAAAAGRSARRDRSAAASLTHRYRLLAQQPQVYPRRHRCAWCRRASFRSRRR